MVSLEDRVRVIGISEAYQDVVLVLEGEAWVLGRAEGCDVLLDELTVSGRHARIVKEGGSYFLEDLDSSNGTYLNGVEIMRERLRTEDVFRLDQVEFQFLDPHDLPRTLGYPDTGFRKEKTFVRPRADLAEMMETTTETPAVIPERNAGYASHGSTEPLPISSEPDASPASRGEGAWSSAPAASPPPAVSLPPAAALPTPPPPPEPSGVPPAAPPSNSVSDPLHQAALIGLGHSGSLDGAFQTVGPLRHTPAQLAPQRQAFSGARNVPSRRSGVLSGILVGVFLGSFVALGVMWVVHWMVLGWPADPVPILKSTLSGFPALYRLTYWLQSAWTLSDWITLAGIQLGPLLGAAIMQALFRGPRLVTAILFAVVFVECFVIGQMWSLGFDVAALQSLSLSLVPGQSSGNASILMLWAQFFGATLVFACLGSLLGPRR